MAIGRTNCGVGGSTGGLPQFTYTGDCTLLDDGNKNWRVKFLTSGTLTFEKSPGDIDVFCVGPGGSSIKAESNYTYIGGPGGGYTKTEKSVTVINGQAYAIVIGAPVAAGNGSRGGTTAAFGVRAEAGYSAYYNNTTPCNGFDGGSGGGDSGGRGGTDGNDGTSTGKTAGVGQGSTTREFGEADGTLYSSGGNGTKSSGTHNTNGEANTGNAANPGSSARLGGSGIVIIRNKRG